MPTSPSTRLGPVLPVRRWSLRTRLVVALVALLAVVCTLVGVATSVAVQRYQLAQLDAQLVRAAGRAPADGDRSGGTGATGGNGGFVPESGTGRCADSDSVLTSGTRFLLFPGQAEGTLAASIDGDDVTAAYLGGSQACPESVSAADAAALADLHVGRTPQTEQIGSLGDYRLIASNGPDGTVLVTGLPLSGLQATQRRLVEVELAVSAVAIVVAALAAAAIVRGALRPLSRVAATATKVSSMPLERGEVDIAVRVPEADTDPRTEAGQVGAALNTLLGHVGSALAARHDSEVQVRQFVADASHELRTPLASIRGYTELVNRDPDALPPQAAYALRRVESEARRMTGLVEDLLLLARLDSGRPLELGPVDLTQLTVDALSDAAAAGREHSWRLDVPDEPVVALGDAARLHQVLANLLTNSRTHTPPGTTVTARLRGVDGGSGGGWGGGLVELSVVDDGPGVPPDLLPHVFDRFARGDTSRSRAAGSSGLGLAIVSAIVTALGGSVDVTSRPGHTAFVVRLPAQPGTAGATATPGVHTSHTS